MRIECTHGFRKDATHTEDFSYSKVPSVEKEL